MKDLNRLSRMANKSSVQSRAHEDKNPNDWHCGSAGHRHYKSSRGLVIHLIDVHKTYLVDPRTGVPAGMQGKLALAYKAHDAGTEAL